MADSPPNLDFFRSLPMPNDVDDEPIGGIYVVILEKNNCKPKLYIGSRTSARGGVQSRLTSYGRNHNIPRLVKTSSLSFLLLG